MDEILELRVLNEEIRGCLPALEAQALRLESQIYSIDKATTAALAAQKNLPPLLNKTAEVRHPFYAVYGSHVLRVPCTH